MDMTSIASAQASISSLYALVRGAASATIDHGMKAKLIDIQSAILDTQAKLGDAQAERIDLLQQVGELQAKLRELEKAKAALDDYALHEIEKGKFLYKPRQGTTDSAIEHYACPSCHNEGNLSIVQGTKTGTAQVYYQCHKCKFALRVGPSDPQRPLRSSGSVNSW